ncbi:NAD(P)/FAD-dependent oxidoreductase [Salinisphaera sp. G21_0]|uniref:NAD(P)/FAD-dependent oxidoreductase n=1 Tax=Salinisphaera sp. G21_0 TaxID=2821094 RepID=UPI001ADAECA3|nr:NAD(P)/FAD-dependent oxidoreductase [Salinisphaera sp. G21_0]MBO9479982.1 NAD(P)/FAD-dependent oxidoreductase [Salinisphaera sp. G21_0]
MYDFAVIGAGPAGTVSAALLAREGFKVLLVDRPDFSGDKVGESLPSAMNRLLWALKLEPIDPSIHYPIYGTDSYWAGDLIQQDHLASAGGLGWRINRVVFEKQLFTQAVESGVQHCLGRLKEASLRSQTWRLQTDDGQSVKSRFVIDASGRGAVFARKRGVPRVKSRPLVALWAVSFPQPDTQPMYGQTLIESRENGWWYAAQLPDRRWLAILHTNPEQAKIIRRRPLLWHQMLGATELISRRVPLPDFVSSDLQAHDARGSHLVRPYGRQWAACGDSALSFDPISSQGIFNAMASADMLFRALSSDDQDAGLQQYHQKLENIANIYHQRRDWFYQRACRVYQTPFWTEQSLMPCLEAAAES